MTAILEPGPQLKWVTCWKDEALIMEQWNRTRGIDIVQDQWLGEGLNSELRVQITLDVLKQYHTVSLNAWDKVGQQGWAKSLTKIIQGSNESFTDFLQRTATALSRAILDPTARESLTESPAPENANAECKKATRPLGARSAPLYEWSKITADKEANAHNLVIVRQTTTGDLNTKCSLWLWKIVSSPKGLWTVVKENSCIIVIIQGKSFL